MKAHLHRLAFLLALLPAIGCDDGRQERHWPGTAGPAAELPGKQLQMQPPPFSDGMFPCKECHDPTLPVNSERRQLKMAHEDVVLRHDEKHRWCFDCHSDKDRDKLHLAGGELVDFSEAYRLCGQCHGDKLSDWQVGVHGRRSGSWNGDKTYLACASCHSAHAPAFKPLKPSPAPVRPDRLGQGVRR
jgi:hypothetical protein